jgi:hypothetical protein
MQAAWAGRISEEKIFARRNLGPADKSTTNALVLIKAVIRWVVGKPEVIHAAKVGS